MNYLRVSIWSLGTILAIFVAYASFGIVNQTRAPSPRPAPYLWHTATSEANFAYASFALRKSKDPKAVLSPYELGLARQAHRIEPLSSAALGLIIASQAGQGPAITQNKLLALAGKLTRRSSVITSASIEAAARADDQKLFFAWLSRAVLTDSTLRTMYIRAMADATARNGAVEALLPVLGANPSWAQYYWAAVASRPASLANATTLRIAVARRPWGQSKVADTDYALMWRLVGAGQFDGARRLAQELEKAAPNAARTGNILANGNFARQPLLPPMDWVLASSGHLGASIDTGDKHLAVSAIAGAVGHVARQLVELAPGNYRLGWRLDGDKDALGEDILSVALTCAEKGVSGSKIQPIALVAGTHRQDMTVPAGNCRWYWLSIDTHVPDDSAGFDAYLRQVSLTRAD